MKKRVISLLLCGVMVLSMVSPMNALAVDNIGAVMVESESETTSNDNVAIEAETIEETDEVSETEFISQDNVTEMASESVTEKLVVQESETETESITEIVTEKIAIQKSKTKIITEVETLLVPESDTNTESKKLKVEDNETKSDAEAKVGDVFETYFGQYQVLSVGEEPTAALIGDQMTDYDGNFWYGDPSKPWSVKYLNTSFAVTRIECFISGNEVRIPEGVEYIQNQSFKFSSTKHLYLPATLKHFDEDHALDSLESITVAEGNPYYKSVDNVLFTADGKELLLYPAEDIRESYSTPEGTEEIVHGAFYKNFNLKTLDLAYVNNINKYSFSEMQKIETVKFSKSLTTFDPNYTFYRCNTLQNIFVDKENKYFFDDDGVLYFKDDSRFGLICYPASHNLSSYTIPYGVNAISQFAFSQTSVTAEVIIPATMGNIFTGAFIETKTEMDIVLQSSRTKSILQGAFEELCDGSKVIVPTEEIKNGIRKDAFLINYVVDERIPIEIDYERAVSRRNNWYQKDGKKYYYDDNGEFVHGIYGIGAYKKYYFDSDGVQQVGFIDYEGKKYYFDSSYDGVLLTSPGFSTIGDKEYYFNDDNSLYLQKELSEYGVTYYFNTKTGEVICDSRSHTFSDWSVTTPATCIQAGIEEHICSKCQTKETKNLQKREHSVGQWSVKRHSDCVIMGVEERVCNVCGNTEQKQLPLVGHEFSDWNVKNIATCTKFGERERKCAVCSYIEKETTPVSAHVAGAWVITKNPTCTKSGSRTSKCTQCGVIRKTESISATGHSYGGWKTVTVAKVGVAGKKVKSCNKCEKLVYATIPALKPVSVSKASIGTLKYLTYNGKYLSAAPSVKVGSKKLIKNKDYTLSYKNNKYPGKATVKISGKGNYSGYKNISFYIVPKAPASVNVKSPKKGSIVVKYKRATKASGYAISYSSSSKFRGAKTTTTSSSSKTITKLSSKRTYYVKVRSYVTISGKRYYGGYSSVYKIRVK